MEIVNMEIMNIDKVGKVVTLPPEPLAPEDTIFVSAGPLTVGVERRHITTESLRALYAGNPDHAAAFEERLARDGEVDDGGVSLHVLSTANGLEYLRFDCFDEDPHYHYIHHDPDGTLRNRWVIYDAAGNGSMLPWALARLRSRLPEMLAAVGALPEMVAVTEGHVAELVTEVEALVGAPSR